LEKIDRKRTVQKNGDNFTGPPIGGLKVSVTSLPGFIKDLFFYANVRKTDINRFPPVSPAGIVLDLST
jgi:hypothetical protein